VLVVLSQRVGPVVMLCLLGLIRLSITQMVPHILVAAVVAAVSPAAEFFLVALVVALAVVVVQVALVVIRQ